MTLSPGRGRRYAGALLGAREKEVCRGGAALSGALPRGARPHRPALQCGGGAPGGDAPGPIAARGRPRSAPAVAAGWVPVRSGRDPGLGLRIIVTVTTVVPRRTSY